MNELFNVRRGDKQVQLADKKSATELIYTLMVMGCTEPVNQSCIKGCKEFGCVYEVSYADRSVNVIGLNDAILVMRWMLEFGCSKAVVEKVGEVNAEG